MQVEGMVSPAYVVARPKGQVSTDFVEAVLRTPQAVEEMRRHSRGVTDFRLRLYWDEFKTMDVPVPPPSDQQRIVEFNKKSWADAEALASEAEAAIHLLQERRSALISAAVTGKIDIRHLRDAAMEAA